MVRKSLAVLVFSVFFATFLPAQDVERLDAEKVMKFAKPLTQLASDQKDAPIKITPNLDKATAIHKGEYAILSIPDEKATAEALRKIDREIVPLGYLMTHKLTPIITEVGRPLGQHATVELDHDGKKVTVAVMRLAVGKIADRLVLLVYTNEKSVSYVTPLVDEDESREFPVDLEALPVTNGRAALVVHVFGKYKASLGLAPAE